jgi:hypothetical protein
LLRSFRRGGWRANSIEGTARLSRRGSALDRAKAERSAQCYRAHRGCSSVIGLGRKSRTAWPPSATRLEISSIWSRIASMSAWAKRAQPRRRGPGRRHRTDRRFRSADRPAVCRGRVPCLAHWPRRPCPGTRFRSASSSARLRSGRSACARSFLITSTIRSSGGPIADRLDEIASQRRGDRHSPLIKSGRARPLRSDSPFDEELRLAAGQFAPLRPEKRAGNRAGAEFASPERASAPAQTVLFSAQV